MRLTVVLDSDGLIKLTKAGVLARVTATWSCLIPQAVHKERVKQGKQEAYPDTNARTKKLLTGAKALGQGE